MLLISQVANYLLPLVTIPYITRTVGPANYGWIEFATVGMLYFSAIVMYGFGTTATRRVAAASHDMQAVSRIYSTVMSARLLLLLAAIVLFVLAISFSLVLRERASLLMWAFPVVFGWALYPEFLFQGLQRLRPLAINSVVFKAAGALAVFVFLETADQYARVPAINGMVQLGMALALLWWAHRSFKQLSFTWQAWSAIKLYLVEGVYVFLAQMFNRVYVFGAIIFLGFFMAERELGLFAAGMKLITVTQSFLFLPLSGALFPYMTRLYSDDSNRYRIQFKQFVGVMMAVTIAAALVLYALAPSLVKLLFGDEYLAAVPFVRIMAPLLVATTLFYFTVQQGLIVLKRDRLHMLIILMTGIGAVVFNLLFVPQGGAWAASWIKTGVDWTSALVGVILYVRAWKRAHPKQ